MREQRHPEFRCAPLRPTLVDNNHRHGSMLRGEPSNATPAAVSLICIAVAFCLGFFGCSLLQSILKHFA